MLAFDIGANRGDWTQAALNKGYDVIALECGLIYNQLVKNFIYDKRVTPLKYAVSDTNNHRVEFFECVEDGLSTLNEAWLTDNTLPYAGKHYTVTKATTITIDALATLYRAPDLIKIDVEGGEWNVFRGMTKKYGTLAFEWTFELIKEHEKQLDYLYALGYREVAPQFIVHHCEEPTDWYELKADNKNQLLAWHQENSDAWIDGGWMEAMLRPTADVGMLWLK